MPRRLSAFILLWAVMIVPTAHAGEGRCNRVLPVEPTVFTDGPSAITAAVKPAQRLARHYRVPASVTLAQFALESGWGRSSLEANNFFGIKAQPIWAGRALAAAKSERAALRRMYSWGDVAVGCVVRQTTEYVTVGTGKKQRQKPIRIWAAFRGYRSLGDSLEDHARFLVDNPRYSPVFVHANDPKRFAKAVAKAGYATDPKYALLLIGLIRQYGFAQHDIRVSTMTASER